VQAKYATQESNALLWVKEIGNNNFRLHFRAEKDENGGYPE
jgi:hypothetical protein